MNGVEKKLSYSAYRLNMKQDIGDVHTVKILADISVNYLDISF